LMRVRGNGLVLAVAACGLLSAKKPNEDTSNPAYRVPAVSTAPDKSGRPAPPAGFIHPGILVNRAQLNEIKRRVAARIEPQASAFDQLRSSRWGALDYTPHPWKTVECGSYSRPDFGCKDEQSDSQAAYAHALLWYITGETAHAKKAIEIMNAWARTLNGGHTNANGPVQAGWTGALWPRAAEIIRYTYRAWPDDAIAQFQNMLRVQYLPALIHGACENGNKELVMSEAIIHIGVFNDDRAAFDFGVRMWRGRAPAYIYLSKDGMQPVEPAGCGPALWGNKGFTPQLVDGLLQETARDSGHANMGLSAMVNAAETARQQGLDLYSEVGDRIMAALEFQAQYLPPNAAKPPERLEFKIHPTWEIAFNHFYNRLGYPLPKMEAVLLAMRPTSVNHHMAWETLTHAALGSIGLPPVRKSSRLAMP